MLKQKFQSLLRTMIVEQIGLKKSIATFFCCAVESVLRYESVIHKKLAQGLSSKSLVESSIRRAERFFAAPCTSPDVFSRAIWKLLGTSGKVILVIDRTTWCLGKSPINLLVVAVVWKNSAIPIIWETLAKKGGSNTAERKRIMRRVKKVVGVENIEAVLADREFIGQEWFQFLHKQGIPFIIRIKNNSYVTYECGGRTQARIIMKNIIHREHKALNVIISGIPIRLVGTRSVNGELVIVAATRTISGDALSSYRMRWLIELCFRSLKRKGFNLEETHMVDPERINKLFAIIAIACMLVVIAGGLRAMLKKIPIKNHGRPEYAVFTYGLDLMRAVFANRYLSGCDPPKVDEILHAVFDQKRRKDFTLGVKNVGY